MCCNFHQYQFVIGVGPNIKICERVSQSPDDVSKREVDFITWLLLELEFRRRRRNKVREIVSRTQEDGDNGEDEDDGDDEIDRPMEASKQCLVNEKLQIARKCK